MRGHNFFLNDGEFKKKNVGKILVSVIFRKKYIRDNDLLSSYT